MLSSIINPSAKNQGPTFLLSHSTILILSGFMIGLASGNVVDQSSQIYVYMGGAAGLIAYFALGSVAIRRNQRAEQAAVEQATSQLEIRMDRHIPTKTPMSGRPQSSDDGIWSLAEIERQYLSVITARRSKFDKKSSPT